MINYRKPITDLLITNLKALTHIDGTSKLFGDVMPIMVEKANATPVCEVLPSSLSIDIDGIAEDTRRYGFTLVVYDSVGAKTTNVDAAAILARLENIEDILVRYFEQIPFPMERSITGIHIYASRASNGNYSVVPREKGIGIVLQLNIELDVLIQNKNL